MATLEGALKSPYYSDSKYGLAEYLKQFGMGDIADYSFVEGDDGGMHIRDAEGRRVRNFNEGISEYDPASRYGQDQWNSGTLALTEGLQGWQQAAQHFGYPDAQSYIEAIQGPGTWKQDAYGNLTFTPASGTLQPFPEYDPGGWKEDLGGILRVVSPFLPVIGSIPGVTDLVSNALGSFGGGAGSGGSAGGMAPDMLGLWQMGTDAGLSGAGLESFIQSGGTLGSTAVGGGGIAGLATGTGGGMYELGDELISSFAGGGSIENLIGLMQMGSAAGLSGPALEEFVKSGGTMGSTAAGGGGIGLGVSGGNILDLLKKLGLGNPGGGMLSNLLGLGSGIYGLSLAGDQRDLAERALTLSDPFGPERGQYATRLRNLYANPSSISETPGYEAGIDAVTRKMASQGYLGSGNMMTALHRYGGDFFDKEVSRLAALAGAQFNPTGASALLNGNNQANQLASQALASLGYTTRNMGL